MTASSGRRARWLAVTVSAALMAAVPSAAHAGWSRPASLLSHIDPSTSEPPAPQQRTWFGTDAKGDTFAVWSSITAKDDRYSIHARLRPAGGQWGHKETVVRPTAPQESMGLFDAAVASDGTLTVLWATPSELVRSTDEAYVFASTRSRSGHWSKQLLTANDASDLALAVDPHGDAVATWSALRGVRASYRPAGGTWGATETLEDFPNNLLGGTGIQVGLDRSGQATAVWNDPIGCPSSCGLVASNRGADGTWPAATLLRPSPYTTPFSLADGAGGAATIAYAAGTSPDTGYVAAFTRDSASGPWSPSTQLAQTDSVPQAAVGPHGSSTVVWNDGTSVDVADRPLGGAWTTAALATSVANTDVSLSSASDGTVLVGWQLAPDNHRSYRLAVRTPGSTWKRRTPPLRVETHTLATGVGTGGRSIVGGLTHTVGSGAATLEATSFDPARARFGRVRVPTSGRNGQRLTCLARPATWLPSTVRWHFGDGRSARGIRVHHRFRRAGVFHVRATVTDASGSTRTGRRTIRIVR